MVVNKADDMVGWKIGCYPTLEAPVAQKKDKNKGEQTNLSTRPDEENGTKESSRDGQEHAWEPRPIETYGDPGHESQKGGDQGPGIDPWRIASMHKARFYIKVSVGREQRETIPFLRLPPCPP
jgi:hypothetical protein